jgi:hypothetical protein
VATVRNTAWGLLLSLTLFSAIGFTGAKGGYPTGPDRNLTPGSLCPQADEYRYPERVPYCRRDVERDTKQAIIREYDQKFGYEIGRMPRQDFKIDHVIPLCAGGSNERNNLWPQHKSVYNVTDPMEPLACEKMQAGRLRQADAVRMIIRAKLDLRLVPETIRYFESL